jgi:pyruvate dehydrogenase E2 component (dihydrolipoamide acetyltransferase)
MATPIVMPKQGQSVEQCIIVGWQKAIGEQVEAGEILCEVETDKALVEVESPVAGTLLARFFAEGAEVAVLTTIAVVGEPGEVVDDFRPDAQRLEQAEIAPIVAESKPKTAAFQNQDNGLREAAGVSPRARKLAYQKGIALAGLSGSGPAGRIIERDVQAALAQQPLLTPLAKSMMAQGGYQLPELEVGVKERIGAADLIALKGDSPAAALESAQQVTDFAVSEQQSISDEVVLVPVKGVRKIIATRMLESLQTTAQLTLNATAEARAMLAYRQRLKQSAESLGLQAVSLNDLILFAVSRTLPQFPALNALFEGETIAQYRPVHLGFAVDTPRGLLVPVIRQANSLSLKQISQEAQRLAAACIENRITPAEMQGGTFTVSNLGSFGIESFTPVLNPPQVGILGVGNINLKPVEVGGQVEFIPQLGLSLTINHQVVDGAPAARFLQTLSRGLAEFEMLLAL